jgi:hypothetical protein
VGSFWLAACMSYGHAQAHEGMINSLDGCGGLNIGYGPSLLPPDFFPIGGSLVGSCMVGGENESCVSCGGSITEDRLRLRVCLGLRRRMSSRAVHVHHATVACVRWARADARTSWRASTGAPEIVTGGRDGCVRVWDPRKKDGAVSEMKPGPGQVERASPSLRCELPCALRAGALAGD